MRTPSFVLAFALSLVSTAFAAELPDSAPCTEIPVGAEIEFTQDVFLDANVLVKVLGEVSHPERRMSGQCELHFSEHYRQNVSSRIQGGNVKHVLSKSGTTDVYSYNVSSTFVLVDDITGKNVRLVCSLTKCKGSLNKNCVQPTVGMVRSILEGHGIKLITDLTNSSAEIKTIEM